MANRRLPMRKIKEVRRLKYECRISEREIARSCQVSRSTVADYLRRASAAGITNWTEATKLVEADIENRLFPTQPVSRPLPRPLPEWIGAHIRALEYFGCAPRPGTGQSEKRRQ